MSYQENDTIGGDRYRIISRIGGGAMGEVYKAEQIAMHRSVAIKIMHVEVAANNELVERFKREAIAAGQLQHSNICAVSDFDQSEDGNFFIVMEMLEGESLLERLHRVHHMEPIQALNIIKQLLNALQCAHEHGIIHRDVKPENIYLVKRDNTDDFVKLIDFGIAHSSNKAMPTLTQTGELFGTPQYLSPEQARGDEIDNRSDLYSCGIILYEMLTGEPPFRSSNFIELLNMQVFTPAPHLPKDIAQHQVLDLIVQKLLRKDREDRYPTASAVIEDLDNVLFMLNAASPDKAEALASLVLTSPKLMTLTIDPVNKRSKNLTVLLASGILILLVILIAVIVQVNTPKSYIDEKTETKVYATTEPIVPTKPQPFNYEEAGFKVSYDPVLSKNQNLVSAVENYPEHIDSVMVSLNAVKDLYKDHPNYMRLRLMALDKVAETEESNAEIMQILTSLLAVVPDAGRNESVRSVIFGLLNSKAHYKEIMELLSNNPNKDKATGIAWMIIHSPFDRFELRTNRLIEVYDGLDHDRVPEWLHKSVDIWRIDKNNCAERFQLLIVLESEKDPDFKENVLKPLYENKPKKSDPNACIRTWIEQIMSVPGPDASDEEDKPSESSKSNDEPEKSAPVAKTQKSNGSSKSSGKKSRSFWGSVEHAFTGK